MGTTETAEGEGGNEGTQDGTADDKALTPAEKRAQAAEARADAAEKRADAKEAEAAAANSRAAARTASAEPPAGGFTLGSWSEDEWAQAENSTGLDRKQILFNINQRHRTKKEVKDAVR